MTNSDDIFWAWTFHEINKSSTDVNGEPNAELSFHRYIFIASRTSCNVCAPTSRAFSIPLSSERRT